MSSDPVISFDGVGKRYRIGSGALRHRLLGGAGEPAATRDLWALRDVSFSVSRGAVLGIIGPNGAGKSTILKLLAGVTVPDTGAIRIEGRIAPLIELGAGFHPDLSGKQNVYLNGALLGLTRAEIKARYDQIVEFAELAEFMETPVKHYSSGMFVRLGFSLAVHTDPDILLIDEVLSVGDERFQRKCLRKFLEFRAAGKTIVVVSHDLGMVSGICGEMLLLANGGVVMSGSVDGAIGRYLQMIGEGEGVGVLQSGKLTVLFNSGRASIFLGGREITKKLGLYTSMLVSLSDTPGAGIWHDSTRAVWACQRTGERSLRCRGEYISLPLVQEWDIEIGDDGTIRWSVVVEATAPVRMERRQANVMLAESYDRWTNGESQGEFPAEFTSRDYHNWDILATSAERSLQAHGRPDMPDVEFRTWGEHHSAAVVNSNFFFSGRVLMFLDLQAQTILPGRVPYFAGELRLDES